LKCNKLPLCYAWVRTNKKYCATWILVLNPDQQKNSKKAGEESPCTYKQLRATLQLPAGVCTFSNFSGID